MVNLSNVAMLCRKNKGSLIILLVVVVIVQSTVATDYCSLCPQHIACKNNGNFGANCSPDRAVLKISPDLKEYILRLHNRMRNELALGNIGNYSSAMKMPTFQWSDELSYLAELNGRSCNYGHDLCRSTEKFLWAGQNIARRGNTKGYEKIKNAVKNMITDWFLEYRDANMGYIDRFRNHAQGKKIGHFTIMANDKNNFLGCALTRYQRNNYKYYYFVCDYSFTNIFDEAVYEKGPAASKCTQPHPVYKGLCSTNQIVSQIPG